MKKQHLILGAAMFVAISGSLAAQVMPGSVSGTAVCRIPMKIVEAAIGESTLLPNETGASTEAASAPLPVAKQAADSVAGAAWGARHFLAPNVPNPFRERTTISYSIPRDERVTIRIYDAFYNQITVLVDEEQAAGLHSVPFDAAGLSSGFFFYSLTTTSQAKPDWERMVLMR
jgi:hypothetical protein